MMMKLILLLVLSCLALHNGQGAPTTARYHFLKCKPGSNCVTYRSPEMQWSSDLPAKIPAASAKHLEAEPVEDEHPDGKGNGDDETEEVVLSSDKGESPMSEEGSGFYEGSGAEEASIADQSFPPTESETGSAEGELDPSKDEDTSYVENKVFRRSLTQPEEQDLKEDHLLQL